MSELIPANIITVNVPEGRSVPSVWIVPLSLMTQEQWSYFEKSDCQDMASLFVDCNETLPFELKTRQCHYIPVRPDLPLIDISEYYGVEDITKYSIKRMFRYSVD